MLETIGFMKFVLFWALGLVVLVLGFVLVYARLTREQIHDLLRRLFRLPFDIVKLVFRVSGLISGPGSIDLGVLWGKIVAAIRWILDKRLPYL